MEGNTHEIVVVRHNNNFHLGVPPVKRNGTVEISSPVHLQFQGSSPLTPPGPGASFTATGEPGRYWFGFDGETFPYCIEISKEAYALETVRLNFYSENDQKTVRVRLQFDATQPRSLSIVRENLDTGQNFEVALVLSNNQRFSLSEGEGTNIWNLNGVNGNLQLWAEAPADGGVRGSRLPKRLGQVVGGEMADIEIG